jgi:hypothetical protein
LLLLLFLVDDEIFGCYEVGLVDHVL